MMIEPSLLTSAIETNQYTFWLETARLTGYTWYRDERIAWVDCSPSPSPQGIFAAQLADNEAVDVIQWVKSRIAAGKAPRKWMTGPASQPANLEALLEQHGFVRRTETLGMALDLSLPTDEKVLPPGVEIQPVDRNNLMAWARVVGTGLFQCGETAADAFGEVMGILLDRQRVTAYLARHQGQPAAASMLYCAEGVAGIYYVATLPQYRNRGIGYAITHAPLRQARCLGIPAAILQATEAGARVYRKLGFQTYSLLGRYWLPEG